MHNTLNDKLTKAALTLCAAAVVSLAGACGGASGAGTDGGPGQTADSKPTSSACEGELVFPARKLGIAGGVIHKVSADETDLYFSAQNEEGIFRVPVGGGEPVRLTIEGEQSSVALFWRYGDNLLLYFDASAGKPPRLVTMPLSGGAVTPFMELTDFVGASIRSHEFGLGSATFYRDGDLLIAKGMSAGMIGIFKVDLVAKTHTFIPTPGAMPIDFLTRSGNTFFFSTNSQAVTMSGEMSSISVDGGAITPLLPTMYADPVLADDSFVYFIGGRRDERLKKVLYRMPVSGGGEPAILRNTATHYYHGASTPEGHVLSLDTLLYVPRGGGEPVTIGCPRSNQALAAYGKAAYVSVVNDNSEASVARFRIP